MALSHDVVLFCHTTGNHLGNVLFVWKVPVEASLDVLTNGNAQCFRKIEPDLPVYHTRAMRRQFFDKISLLRCGKPSVLRGFYKCLTGRCEGWRLHALLIRG